MASIYLQDIRKITPDDCARVARVLPGRYAQAQKYLQPADRLRCMGAGLLLIDKLGITDESLLEAGEFGKLAARGFPQFNLSHSGDYAVLAVGDSDAPENAVGVDIEQVREDNLPVAEHVYTPEELAWMRQEDPLPVGSPLESGSPLWEEGEPPLPAGSPLQAGPLLRFHVLWTQKESIMKLFGLGMQLEPRSFDVCALQEGKPARVLGQDVRVTTQVLSGSPGYVLSVACLDR